MKNRAFTGVQRLYGDSAFNIIQNSHILVVGIGGVGSWSCESLVRSGVGEITIIDLDDVCVSNINRQIHSTIKTIGALKIDVMKERLLLINPDLKIHTIHALLTEKNIEKVLQTKFDFIIDAIDRALHKSLLISEAQKRKINIVTIGGAGGKLDPTLIEIRDLNRTINDKLLLQVRRSLKKDYKYSKFTNKPYRVSAIFSTEIAQVEDVQTHDTEDRKAKNCQTGYIGSSCAVTASMGFFASAYVLKNLTQIDSPNEVS